MQTMRPTTKPSKQRKRVYAAPDHIRHKMFAALLSSDLRKSQKVRSLPVRSGDTVRVMRGDHKGFEGKVSRIDREKYRIYVEGLTREKVDGTTIFVPIHPSKVTITKLNLDDKWRKEILERKKGAKKAIEEVAEKPAPRKPAEKPPQPAEVVQEKPAEKKAVQEEKAPEEKPKAKPRRRAARKTATAKAEKEPEEAEKAEKPKTAKKRTRRKTADKTAETEGGA